jgi:hypothetical protein
VKPEILMTPLTPAMEYPLRLASVEDDGHQAPLATHVFTREGKVVGSAGLCVPSITFWAHSKELHARESLELLKRCQIAAAVQHRAFLGLCSVDSPFHSLVSRFGWKKLGNADVFQHSA